MTEAQQAEATGGTIAVEYNGETYQADPTQLTWELLEQDAVGNYARVVAAMLGPEEFKRFQEHNPQPLIWRDGALGGVADEMRSAIVAAMGNPRASSNS